MKNLILCALCLLMFIGCQDAKPTEQTTDEVTVTNPEKSSFKMYDVSEMAALMERMYADNKRIKEKIEQGDTEFGNLPEEYLQIYTAKFTDPSDLDDFFTEHAKIFLEAQELVYTDTENSKANFNKMVNSCIECHHKKCSGPIERIKKLYIK
jgi:cytochrome c553